MKLQTEKKQFKKVEQEKKNITNEEINNLAPY
jgi:hypothetical protein